MLVRGLRAVPAGRLTGTKLPKPTRRTSLPAFSVIVGKDEIRNYKPHPDTYLIAAKRLGINRNTLRKKIRDLDIQLFRGGN